MRLSANSRYVDSADGPRAQWLPFPALSFERRGLTFRFGRFDCDRARVDDGRPLLAIAAWPAARAPGGNHPDRRRIAAIDRRAPERVEVDARTGRSSKLAIPPAAVPAKRPGCERTSAKRLADEAIPPMPAGLAPQVLRLVRAPPSRESSRTKTIQPPTRAPAPKKVNYFGGRSRDRTCDFVRVKEPGPPQSQSFQGGMMHRPSRTAPLIYHALRCARMIRPEASARRAPIACMPTPRVRRSPVPFRPP